MRLPFDARIYVAGHDSPLGRMLCRKLQSRGYQHVVTREAQEVNLCNQLDVNLFFEQELPDYVFVVNDQTKEQVEQLLNPAEYLYSRLLGLSNIIHASYVYEVRKLLNITFTAENAAAVGALSSEAAEEPSAEELVQLVTLGLCDRYRRQYTCDFISAHFHFALPEVGAPSTERPSRLAATLSLPGQDMAAPGVIEAVNDQFYSLDPTDACLFLMEHFSAAGAISVRTGQADQGNFAAP